MARRRAHARLPQGVVRVVRVTRAARTPGRGPYVQAHLHLPAPLARLVGDEATFQAELTDEGILYRYLGGQARPRDDERALPGWVTDGDTTKGEHR